MNRLREINSRAIEWLQARGIDLAMGDRIELAPAVQHFQGGVKIRERAQTTVAGLYAAGECAGGQHGANRPGGHALLDAQVFGRRAGEYAAAAAHDARDQASTGDDGLERIASRLARLQAGGGRPASEARHDLQQAMSAAASVIRTDEGLAGLLAQLAEIRQAGIAADDQGVAFACETENVLLTAEMVARAARRRHESRGPHLFFAAMDAPERLPRDDEHWKKYIVIVPGEEMQLEVRDPAPLGA
jgi:succinate dehydrogenase / fumarate reductase flavoprotein subunit